ncbi:MAG TPA: hypothetical protein VGN72_02085 [Tepidisphaeraceae bacterium]|jgi:DNA-binding NtrC family response regulator|nr:hypothetical protein [Tepidisphaeraceae bacterium]
MSRPTPYKLVALDQDLTTLRTIAEAAAPYFDVVRVRDAARAITMCDEDAAVRVIVAESTIYPPTGTCVLDVVRLRRPSVRRVMLTTYEDLSMIVNGLHTGAIQHLAQKPIQIAELVGIISRFAEPAVLSGVTDPLPSHAA